MDGIEEMKITNLHAYRLGWIDGAALNEISKDRRCNWEEYERGYADGRKAHRHAIAIARKRLNMPSPTSIKLCDLKQSDEIR